MLFLILHTYFKYCKDNKKDDYLSNLRKSAFWTGSSEFPCFRGTGHFLMSGTGFLTATGRPSWNQNHFPLCLHFFHSLLLHHVLTRFQRSTLTDCKDILEGSWGLGEVKPRAGCNTLQLWIAQSYTTQKSERNLKRIHCFSSLKREQNTFTPFLFTDSLHLAITNGTHSVVKQSNQ